MRILFTSTRGQGHIRPLLPFAKALIERSHDVRIASPEDNRSLSDKAGLELMPFDRLSDAEIKAFWSRHQGMPAEEAAQLAVRELFSNRTVKAALPKLAESIETWQPDILLRDSIEFAGFVLAEKHGIAHARIAVHNNEVEARLINMASPSVDGHFQDLGLPKSGEDMLWAEPAFTGFPMGFDGECRHGPDNPPFRVNLTADAIIADSDWTPKTSRPLVYMTFGTVAGGDQFGFQEVFDFAIEAVRGLDVEALLTTGPNIDPSSLGPAPDNLEIRSFVPQDAVLRRARAAIHHGGSGTLTGSLAAGVPMVVVPLFADQPWNAERVEAAGLGQAVLDRSAGSLREALVSVLEDDAMLARSKDVAREMASMPAIGAAVARIEGLAASP